MVFQLGQFFPHKTGCKCFRCSGIVWHKGKKTGLIPKSAFKKGDNLEENNFNWKGDAVSYWGLHKWVQSKLGNPNTCENCGANGLSGREIHWANKDHTYKRNINDWVRLCSACHRVYDIGRGYVK